MTQVILIQGRLYPTAITTAPLDVASGGGGPPFYDTFNLGNLPVSSHTLLLRFLLRSLTPGLVYARGVDSYWSTQIAVTATGGLSCSFVTHYDPTLLTIELPGPVPVDAWNLLAIDHQFLTVGAGQVRIKLNDRAVDVIPFPSAAPFTNLLRSGPATFNGYLGRGEFGPSSADALFGHMSWWVTAAAEGGLSVEEAATLFRSVNPRGNETRTLQSGVVYDRCLLCLNFLEGAGQLTWDSHSWGWLHETGGYSRTVPAWAAGITAAPAW